MALPTLALTRPLPSLPSTSPRSSSSSSACSPSCSFPATGCSNFSAASLPVGLRKSLVLSAKRRSQSHVVRMAPDEEKMTRRSPLDFPIEWERPKPGRRPDIFPQFAPIKTPLPIPMPADPPEEDEEEEEKKEEEQEEEDPETENPDNPEKK